MSGREYWVVSVNSGLLLVSGGGGSLGYGGREAGCDRIRGHGL